MRPLFNIENDNNNSNQGYPLFLGPELGLMDNTHVTYPIIAELRDKMVTDNWRWDEITFAKDAKDIQDPALAAATDVMIKNLSFQYAADSVAECAIHEILGMFCSNTEMEGLLKFWGWNEYVHAMQYSEIVKTAFPDSNNLMEEMKALEPMTSRLQPFAEVFEATRQMGYKYQLGLIEDVSEVRKQILRFMGALLALEAVSFATSFAATFAVGRGAKAYDGFVKAVQLVARDELETHVKADLAIIDILRNQEGWEEEWQAVRLEVSDLFYTVMESEEDWADFLFSEGRQVVGLNKESLLQYCRYLFTPINEVLGLNTPVPPVKENPLPWMQDYLDLDAIQVAAQEGQINNYKVNVISDDSDDEEDFDF